MLSISYGIQHDMKASLVRRIKDELQTVNSDEAERRLLEKAHSKKARSALF